MSEFQPINKAKSIPKPAVAHKSSDPPVTSAADRDSLLAIKACASNFTRGSASSAKPCKKSKTKSPMVVVPAKSLQASPPSEASHGPQKVLQKNTPKALRKQAVRAVKLVPTVEHPETTLFTGDTSTPSPGAESDSNWSAASTHLGELDSGTSSQTPHRRSPRHLPFRNSFTGCTRTRERMTLSPSARPHKALQHEFSGDAVKEEDTVSPDQSVIRPRSLSPSDFNRDIREKKFQEEDFVEVPPAEWAYQRYVWTKEENRKGEVVMENRWKEELRKQKGKQPERGLEGNAGISSTAPSKRKVREDRETEKAVKRQKSHKEEPLAGRQPLQNAASRTEEPLMTPSRYQRGQTSPSGKQQKLMMSARSQPEAVVSQTANEVLSRGAKGAATRGNETSIAQPNDSGKEVHISTLCIPTGPKASQSRPKQISRPWQQACNTREVELHLPRLNSCECKHLPEYFKQRNERRKAESSSAPGGKESNNDISDPTSFAEDWLSSSRSAKPSSDMYALYDRNRQRDEGLSSEYRERQQSSIEPKTFYGRRSEYRVPPKFHSSPSIPDKILTNENKHRNAERLKSANVRTPPDSSPASKVSTMRGKSTCAHVPFEIHVEDDWQPLFDDDDPMFPTPISSPFSQSTRSADSSDDQSTHTSRSQSNSGDRNIRTTSRPQTDSKDQPSLTVPEKKVDQRPSKGIPESPNGRPQPQRSLGAQRRRYQSVPLNLLDRTTTVGERDAQRRDNTLQELSSNAILLNLDRRIASFQKQVLELLPTTPQIQSAVVLPATAPTAAVVVGDEDERAHRRRWKRASDAERQRRFPKLSRDVPHHLRLPDEGIIRIGKIKNGYKRHKAAPYAFSWRGRLYSDYKHLTVLVDSNGSTVWSAKQLSRMRA